MIPNNKYALITGATSGIGLELAKVFAANGYDLVIVARNENELASTANFLRSDRDIDIITIAKDLFDVKNAFALYDEVKAKGINIEVLVNDAGQGQYGEFVDTDIERELAIIQLNVASVVVLTKQFLKDMVSSGKGKILNVASIAGKLPGPLQAVYHATKSFVHSFTIAVREEVKETGVSLTSLLPGATDTDFFRKADMERSKIVQEGTLDDPAKVAQDGYDALIAGDSMVVSGMKNKMQVAMGNIMPDSAVAHKLHKDQAPINDSTKDK